MASILLNDTELRFPDFTVVSASAGSGKTHTLTLKLLQVLLSPRVQNHRLPNILAMTFTKNAAAEMRQRVLEYLKKAHLGDTRILLQLTELISQDEDQLRERCGELIEFILQDYSAFQVQTIDSFMARVFRASALEFGYSPSMEIVLNNQALLDEAFEQFARELATDTSKRHLLDELTEILVEHQHTTRYIWNPFQNLSAKVRELYSTLSAQPKEVVPSAAGRSLSDLREEILGNFHRLQTLVKESGLEIQKNFEAVMEAARSGDVDDFISRKSLYNPPHKAGKSKAEKTKGEEWNARFEPLQEELRLLAAEYIVQKAYTYYRPYVEAHRLFNKTVHEIMHRNGEVYLTDVNRALLQYVSQEIVPQVYYYLGETIFHYLIDEFQDTAPVQWQAVKPLLAETLSKQGSLFIVGDTKQSIYAFRHADWKIMKSVMESVVFPSAPPVIKDLETNYRSCQRILDFNKEVFHRIIPGTMEGEAPHASGLSTFKQEVDERNKNKGYVEVLSYERDDDHHPERDAILKILADCRQRGYVYGDITILTPKNEHVIAVSGWLNSAQIRFVSYSSLDIRGRAVTNHMIALLRFLDSPIDDLAFATFILSETFRCVLTSDAVSVTAEELRLFLMNSMRGERKPPLYASFRKDFSSLWDRYFEDLFTVVGYLPMYDLLSEMYKRFRLFELLPDEEAALAKLLEVIKNFEGNGQNNLKDFLAFTDDEGDDGDWNIAIPHGADAVQVMTIHKAKGLDNRVVLVLLVDSKPHAENLFMKEEDEGVQLVHITKETAEIDETLGRLYQEHRLTRNVDDLNKLYVAFTRAKEELYVISVKGGRVGEPSKYLPQTGYEPSTKPEVEQRAPVVEPSVSVYHTSKRIKADIVPAEKMAFYERRRGEVIHEALSRVEFADAALDAALLTVLKEISENETEPEEISRMHTLLLEFIRLPEMEPFFAYADGRRVLNEQEFVTPEGRLFRMDRIVVDAESVAVLDFKTGSDKEGYTGQVKGYMDILRNFYPNRTINGVLAFVDRKKVRLIE